MEIVGFPLPHVTRGKRPAFPFAAARRQELKQTWNQ